MQGVADVTARARQGEGAEGALGVAAGGRLLAESQLRQLVTPDQWCAHEAMRAGRLRLAAAGVAKHERLAALPPERLRVAAEQLAPAPVHPLIWVIPAQICSKGWYSMPGCHQRCSCLCWRAGGAVQCQRMRWCCSCLTVFGLDVGQPEHEVVGEPAEHEDEMQWYLFSHKQRCGGAQGVRRAVAAAALAVAATPWALTDNFLAAREGRGRLALTGPGDPTGRGLGFSLMRDTRRARPPLGRC